MAENGTRNLLHARFVRFAGFSGGFAIVLGLLVLIGWTTEVDRLKRVIPGLISMNPMTAVCFVIAGVSLVLQYRSETQGSRRVAAGRSLGAIVAAIGLLVMGRYVFGWSLQLDQVLFSGQLPTDLPGIPNRMAPNTAFSCTLLGSGLFLGGLTTKRGTRPAEWFAVLCWLLSLAALAGYVYQVEFLYGLARHVPMALHTALGLHFLSMGLLFSRPGLGMMRIIAGDSPGGLLMRRLFPLIVPVFIVLGCLQVEGQRRGLFEAEPGIAITTVTSVAISGLLILWCARFLQQADLDRKRVERERERFFTLSKALEEHASDALDDTGRSYIDRVRKAADRMGELIDDLLNLSRLTRAKMNVETVDLSEIARSLVAEYRAADPAREVETVIAPDIRVLGDPALLRVLLDNLLGNAWKFTAKNPAARIEVGGTTGGEGKTVCHVRDNGVGFDPRYSNKLFGAFQRLHSQAEFPGTGIGLATVQRIVSRHGGEVRAEGEINHGATFSFVLGTRSSDEKQNHTAGGGQSG